MSLQRSLCFRLATAALGVLMAASLPRFAGAAGDIEVTFGSLPSAQGWTYTSGGIAAVEATTWGVSGGVLSYNTMPFLTNTSGTGTSSFYRNHIGLINATEPIMIEMRARLLQHEHDGSAFIGGGLSMGFINGTTSWSLGILPTDIRNINNTILSSGMTNSQFHNYRLEWSPGPVVKYYVDNVQVSPATPAGGFSSPGNNYVLFGDGTGAANAQAEITYFRFRQGAGVTSADGGSWGHIKALYR
jgi:hypothetical protein